MISALSSTFQAAPSAADSTAAAQKFFNRLDRDSDGRVSAEEFTTAMQRRFGHDKSDAASGDVTDLAAIFKQADADGDGQINQDEFKSALANVRDALRANAGHQRRGPDPTQIFGEADADASGSVTADELKTHFEQNVAAQHPGANAPDFAQLVSGLDQDGDGALSESEFAAMRPPPPPVRANGDGFEIAALFSSVDSDEDGLITLEEFTTGLAAQSGESEPSDISKLFANFDDDEDGKLSQTELEAMLEQARHLAMRRASADRYEADGRPVTDDSSPSARLDATA